MRKKAYKSVPVKVGVAAMGAAGADRAVEGRPIVAEGDRRGAPARHITCPPVTPVGSRRFIQFDHCRRGDRFDQFRPLVPDVADGLVDLPGDHFFAGVLPQQGLECDRIFQLAVEPPVNGIVREDDRHAGVQPPHHVVRLGRADGAGVDQPVGSVPRLPQAGEWHGLTGPQRDVVRHLVGDPPFIEAGGNYQAAAALERRPKGGLRVDRLRPGVDALAGDLRVLGPTGNQPPLGREELPLAGIADADDGRRGRRVEAEVQLFDRLQASRDVEQVADRVEVRSKIDASAHGVVPCRFA